MVGLWLDFNRTAASLAYVIVLKNRAKKAGLLTRLGCHSFRATGITSICSTAASSRMLSRSAAPLSVPRHVGRIPLCVKCPEPVSQFKASGGAGGHCAVGQPACHFKRTPDERTANLPRDLFRFRAFGRRERHIPPSVATDEQRCRPPHLASTRSYAWTLLCEKRY
jgi:hypothetical protein